MFKWLLGLLGIGQAKTIEISPIKRPVAPTPRKAEAAAPAEAAVAQEGPLTPEDEEFLRDMLGPGPPGDLLSFTIEDRSFVSLLLRKAKAGDVSIPLLPKSATDLRKLGADPDINISKYVEIFKTDPALSAELLKLANSPYFGIPTTTNDLAQAMIRVGFNELSGLVMLMTLRSKLFKSGHFNRENELIAKLALATARGAENLAGELGLSSDEAFTRGLLSHVEFFIILGVAAEFNVAHKDSRVSRKALAEASKRVGPGIFDLVVKKWGLQNLGYSEKEEGEDGEFSGLRERMTAISLGISAVWAGANPAPVRGITSELLTRAAKAALGLEEPASQNADKKMPPPQGGLAEEADG